MSKLVISFSIQLRGGKINNFYMYKEQNKYLSYRGSSVINAKQFFDWYDYYMTNKKFVMVRDNVQHITPEQRQKILELECARML